MENGSPLSRAKAQVRREAEARMPSEGVKMVAVSMEITAVVAPLDCVAAKIIWMMGYLVGVDRVDLMLPMPKRMTIVIPMPETP